eukprot:GHVH01009750.1.p2 GENE.GHVH01009750.1~~GHVH01009750.1.p2  ORF type:complete len:383 (+),score=48.37 GHVH01009750.1:68-1216(+)
MTASTLENFQKCNTFDHTALSPEALLNHEAHMKVAASAARSGSSRGLGGPFGCVIVKDNRVISIAHNTVLAESNPTCHAEMNAIRMACKALKSHDLSDCDLYTSCEPCPMCWGGTHWSRIRHMYIGIDKTEAAKFGWSDEFFYTELGKPAIDRVIKTTTITDEKTLNQVKNLFHESPTSKRKVSLGGNYLQKVYEDIFKPKVAGSSTLKRVFSDESIDTLDHELTDNNFMREAIRLAQQGLSTGQSKEREPFGTVIVKDGKIVGRGHNKVLADYDPTATSEVVAITDACKTLGTHDLTDCVMYSTGEPDVMSMGAIYWANIKAVNIGYSLADAAAAGFEDGLIHYVELNDASKKMLDVYRNIAFDECKEVFVEYAKKAGTMY